MNIERQVRQAQQSRRNGLTLIEVIVSVSVLGLLGAVGTGIQNHLSEEARTAKCQSNLKRQITAIHMYAADYGGTLPGPVHPAIKRNTYTFGMGDDPPYNPAADRKKS